MTLEQTRQLGIEFERRVQALIPDEEFKEKLDTETIYSYLNQYQDKYVHDIYKQFDNIPSQSKPSAYVESILQELLTTYTNPVTIPQGQKYYTITVPDGLGFYLNSYTKVTDSYNYKNTSAISGDIPNILVSQTDAKELLDRPQDNMRIMRQPIACFDKNSNNKTIKVVFDNYTQPTEYTLVYYRTPEHMDLFTSKNCQLSYDAFEDLVSGAVDLYVQYAAGAEARKKQLQQQAQQRAREDERDARRSGNSQED